MNYENGPRTNVVYGLQFMESDVRVYYCKPLLESEIIIITELHLERRKKEL